MKRQYWVPVNDESLQCSPFFVERAQFGPFTLTEARAFIAGVEFVNDDTIEVLDSVHEKDLHALECEQRIVNLEGEEARQPCSSA